MTLKYEPQELESRKIWAVPSVITGFNDRPGDCSNTIRVALLDTETTGLDTANDEVIELGYMVIEVSADTGEFFDVIKRFNQLQQPSAPLPPEITEVTGLTDADLAGQSIDWSEVEGDLSAVSLIVAHNAGFDRKMMERYSPASLQCVWGCSVNDINWKSMGQKNRSQEWLVYSIAGAYYDAHRALDDVSALSLLLSRKVPGSAEFIFKQLIANAREDLCIIKATGSRFEEKDNLKAAGYRWNANEKVWFKELVASELEARKGELREELMTAAPSCNPTMGRIPAIHRYSIRAE